MNPPDKSLLEQAQDKAVVEARVAQGRIEIETRVDRRWRDWVASAWAKYVRRAGPDDYAAGVKVEKRW